MCLGALVLVERCWPSVPLRPNSARRGSPRPCVVLPRDFWPEAGCDRHSGLTVGVARLGRGSARVRCLGWGGQMICRFCLSGSNPSASAGKVASAQMVGLHIEMIRRVGLSERSLSASVARRQGT